MSLTLEKAIRVFRHNGRDLQDPDPAQTPEQVKDFYAGIYPELTNAAIESPETKGATTVYEFRKAVGTKGAVKLRVVSSQSDAIACRIGTQILSDAMLKKLARKRNDGGKGGWNDPAKCSINDLADMLIDHIRKGDPVDIANFAMMLHNRTGGGNALARAYFRHKHLIGLELRDNIAVLIKSEMTKLINKAVRRA